MNRSRALLVLAVVLAAVVAQFSGANPAGAVGGVLSNNSQLNNYDGLAVAWADFNQDGNLDLFTTPGGTMPGLPPTGSATSLFHGNGTTSFALPPDTVFANVTHGSAAWGDYNNDGWPDIAVLGLQGGSTPVTKVYRNNGNGSFSEDTSAGLPGLYYGSIAWGDYDDDGHQDLLLVGKDASSHPHLLVYTNNGDGTFTNDSDAGLVTDASIFPGVSNGSAVWGDYNNDGWPDILVTGGTGITANPRVTKLFENNQDGSFTEDTGAEVNLTPLENSSAAFGDYNNDGRLDILVAGCDASSGACSSVVSKVYTNQGLNSGVEKAFTQDVPTATLWGFQNGGAAWGDYTNDGKLDLALSGDDASSSPRFTKAYAGNGSGGFTADANSLPPLDGGTVAFGDYNNDSKLDLVAAGSYATRLIDNDTSNTQASDAAPGAPTSPAVSYTPYSATFSWGAASDDHTPPAALTYNLCVGTTAGGCDVVSALSNLSTGKRLVPQAGNVGQALTYTLNLTPGRHYYWHVQAVDGSFVGGPFVSGQMFTPGLDGDPDTFPGVSGGSVAFGDYNSDGRLEAVVTGTDVSGAAVAKVYHQVWFVPGCPHPPFCILPHWVWQEDASANLAGVSDSSAAWGDYNNDGHLDLLIAGMHGSTPTTTLYTGDGVGGFTPDTSASFIGVLRGAVAFGDYNSDGRADVVVTGWDNGSPGHTYAKLYRNNGDGTFTEDTSSGLAGVNFSSIAVGDFNRDGRPDLLIAGSTTPNSSSPATTTLYKNNGDGTFTNLTTSAGLSAAGVEEGTVAWGDYNSDGWPDILASGEDSGGSGSAKVYANNGNGTFTQDASAALPWQQQGAAAWGDYNADGKPDILLAGLTPSGPISGIFENQGNGAFSDIEAGLTGVTGSSVAWGDYDGNGTLDALVAGCTVGTGGGCTNSTNTTTLYTSSVGPNAAPNVPTGLTPSFNSGTGVETLNWSAPTDDHTPSAALTYNVRVGTTTGGSQLVSPLSNTSTGTTLVPQDGNAGARMSFTLPGLASGNYHWSVQAVDSGFAGSPFASEGAFWVPPGLFNFSVANYSVAEGAGSATVTITRTYGSTVGAATVHFATSDGTATAGSDYTAMSQTVNFASGETSKTVSIPVTDDNLVEGSETVQLLLSSPTNGGLGIQMTGTLTINDNDRAFAFSSAAYSAGEADGHATITINRAGLTTGTDTVHVATANGSAKAGSDYTAVSQTISFSSGETSKTVSIPIIDDSAVESSETVLLSLSSPSTGATLGSPSAATLTIRDNDVNVTPPPAVKPSAKLTSGKLTSAKLSKKSFPSTQARKVKLGCRFSPKSKVFRYVLSLKKGKKWTVVKRVSKTGFYKLKYTLTVKQLFGGTPVKRGQYRLRLSADANSKTLSFRVV